MEALELARWQFALTAGLHFLFVSITLGMAPIIAYMQTRYVFTGREVFDRLTRYWGQVYVINYALGVVTGIVMEFQFGVSWSGLAHYAGDVFGAPLALETITAFFLESTFLGLWIFGWGILPRWLHLVSFYIVTATAYLSAFWIMVANGFMQNPVGYTAAKDGTLRLTDFAAVLTNEGAVMALVHVCVASLGVGGFLVAGASAWHLLRGTTEHELFRRSLRTGVLVGWMGVWFAVLSGFPQLAFTQGQPGKSAALGGDTEELARLQEELSEQVGYTVSTPPPWLETLLALMQSLGYLLWMVGTVAIVLFYRGWLEKNHTVLYALLGCIPLPYVAVFSGWMIREMGRQPWLLYGEVTVNEGMTEASIASMQFSLVAFVTVFGVLAVIDVFLIWGAVRRGPDRAFLGAAASGGRVSHDPASAEAVVLVGDEPDDGTRADAVSGLAGGRR
ncbi:cytochrome ubiquinol oxidase subunit I [Streptomonospora algeriensis]|uniref:Cytochrome ubiquinol oxidase subunit I n=1 Tax=Streptomonospora algeriensis TaxID=995084 RepID=A0ABW3BC68_9ACTN